MNKEIFLKMIATLEIIGGSIGVLFSLIKPIDTPAIVVYLAGFSLISGLVLLKRNRMGLLFSMLNQVLQIFTVSTQYLFYKFSMGVGLFCYIDKFDKHINFVTSWGSYVNVVPEGNTVANYSLNTPNIETGSWIGFNLIAILCLIYLTAKLIKTNRSKNSSSKYYSKLNDSLGAQKSLL